MSELRLFTIHDGKTTESRPAFYKLEREVQNLFEANLESLLGVRFVASEFSTGQGGRIDTLGIDENGFPVVIEYKLDKNRTVINQGMAYMAWLRGNKDAFWRVVFNKLGQQVADSIDHSSTRLICIATDFSRDDLGAYELMPNSIDLVRYRRFGETQLLLERITNSETTPVTGGGSAATKSGPDKPISQVLEEASPSTKALFERLKETIMSQGEDVSEKATKLYLAYKRTRNFATIVAKKDELLLFLHLNPDHVEITESMRDVRSIGHWGTGDLEIKIRRAEDVAQAELLIAQAYEGQL